MDLDIPEQTFAGISTQTYQLYQKIGQSISIVDLYKMVTTNPASALGSIKCGRIHKGFFVDLFILRTDSNNQSPIDALINLDDRSVIATIVNGRIVYGSPEIYQKLRELDYEMLSESEDKVALTKAVSIKRRV